MLEVHSSESTRDEDKQFILTLKGLCITLPEVALMFEYCPGGNLQDGLKEAAAHSQGTVVAVNQDHWFRQSGAMMSVFEPPGNALRETLLTRLMWALQVAQGMRGLHAANIAHRRVRDSCLAAHCYVAET